MVALNAPPATAEAPFVSVVAPVFNGSRFIVDSLRAMLAEFERLDATFEIVVVCDGSTDGTAELARSVTDERVRVVRYPDNNGKGLRDRSRGGAGPWTASGLAGLRPRRPPGA